MRTVSPTGGSIRSATGCWARAIDAVSADHTASITTRARMARSSRLRTRTDHPPAWCAAAASESWLARRHDAAKLRREKRLHVVRTRVQRRVARADDFLLGGNGNDVLHPA